MALNHQPSEVAYPSHGLAIQLENISKCYRLYEKPQDRLRQAIWGRRHTFYQQFWALHNLNLCVAQGNTLGIVGRNGSGKSTLLQLICRILAPTTGTVRTAGQIAALLELGSGFNPEFTGLENIYFNAGLLGYRRSQVDEMLDDILAFADIGNFIHRPVKTYSTGMVVRLAFAVAIQSRSRIIIVDEALAVGDPAFQYKCYQQLRELIASRQSTVLLVSHDLNAITEFCSEAILLDQGHLIAQGAPREICALFRRRTNVKMLPAPGLGDSPSAEQLSEEEPCADQQPLQLAGHDGLDAYGDGSAAIEHWDVQDAEGRSLRSFENTEMITIRMRVRYLAATAHSVIGFFVSDVKGRELVGTNTLIEGRMIGVRPAGDAVSVAFTQVIPLAAGQYFLNLGCSEIVDGHVVAKHRLYQVALLAIRSDRSQVGLFQLDAHTQIQTYAVTGLAEMAAEEHGP